MGTLRYPPLERLALQLRDAFHLEDFVETGTYQGETTSWGAEHFARVHTIDISTEHTQAAKERCDNATNVSFWHGDSRNMLPALVTAFSYSRTPALYWLDAHNASGLFGPGPDDCPLMQELACFEGNPLPNCILIDDANCYIPPKPHTPEAWPDIEEVQAWADRNGFLMKTAHDVIALVPPLAWSILDAFGPTSAETNQASAMVNVRNLAKNVRARFQPKVTVKAHMVQGGVPPGQLVTFDKEPAVLPIAELVDTIYGKLIVPRFDVNQTPALRHRTNAIGQITALGQALDQGQINVLIAIISQRPPGRVFIDVGANTGVFSFAMQPYCERIYAFEPQRIIANMIAGSIALNGWTNIFCYNHAVGDRMDRIEMPQFDYTKHMSFGSIEFGPAQVERQMQERQYDPAKVEQVAVVPLDEFTFSRVDMIKIDVEGYEYKVIEGAKKTIATHKPILFIEHEKVKSATLRRQIDEFGIYDITDVGANFVCIPKGE